MYPAFSTRCAIWFPYLAIVCRNAYFASLSFEIANYGERVLNNIINSTVLFFMLNIQDKQSSYLRVFYINTKIPLYAGR